MQILGIKKKMLIVKTNGPIDSKIIYVPQTELKTW